LTPKLHERFPVLAQTLPHLALSERPTSVRELTGPGIWVKEDGAFGSGGWGGNKVRKLEWLIPDAKRRGRGSILTFGGLGTNWGLATALYAREHGLETALALVDQPVDDHVRANCART
jgi:D-cysteine desulfhydrase